MANLSLIFDVMARDQASATLRKVGDEVERTGKKTEGLGNQLEGHAKRVDGFASSLKGFGAALGGLAIVGTFKGLYDAAAESARISRLTESTIKSTGGAANITAKQIGDLATAISNKTGADDEAIQSGENLLLTFTNVRNEVGAGNDIFSQATQLALDMSTALGTDMSSASLQLGKALNDPIKGISALSRAGVSFTEQQKDQIKTLVESGNTMGAQKIILGELAKEFGGAAEAASTPLDKMVTRLGNVAEEAGGHLIPVMNEMIDVLGNVLSVGGNVLGFVTDLPAPLQLAAGAAVAWALAGDKITGAFGGARDKIRAFREESELQRALFAAQARDISDTDRALGGLGTTTETTGTRFGTARAAVAGFAKAIGPELGLALATFVISDLVSSIDRIAHAGDDATRDITAFDRSLSHIDTNSGRIEAVSSRIDDLKDKIADLVNTMPSNTEFGTSAFNPLALADMIAKFKDGDESADRFGKQLQQLQEKQKNYEAATTSLSAQLGISKDTVAELADKYGIDLSQGIGAVTDKFMSSQAAADVASGAVASVGNAADLTQDQIDEAAKAIEDWRKQLQQIGASFVEPLSVYKSLLDEKTQAERDQAQATADATESSKDSWKDYVKDVSLSLDEYATKLQEEITNQENWRTNLGIVAARAGDDVAKILAGMGQDGVDLVAQMANGTDAEMKRMADLLRQDATLGGYEAGVALETQMKVMAAIGAAGGKETAQQIADKLGLGLDVVMQIAAQYASTLGNGINPLLAALGHAPVRVGTGVGRAIGQAALNAEGNLYENHQAEIAPGGAWRVWAEPETGGEAYIPLASSKRDRSLGIWREVGKRLGVTFREFATGGFWSESDVPRPYSTAPFGPPISTSGDATMGKEYDSVTSYLKTALSVGVGPSGSSGGAARWSGLVLQALAMMGQPASLLSAVLRRMNQESGGNPRAINLWDINAKRGVPSKGLMQTIDPTFRAYHDPRTSWDIYDPLANVLASMRYAMARYGSLSAAYNRAGGYKLGTDFVPEDGLAYLHRGEAVVPADRNQGAPWQGGGPLVIQLDGPATVDLLEGRAVSVVTSYASTVYNRTAF